MCLLDVFVDQDCPARVFSSFIDGWISAGTNIHPLYEWMTEKMSKIILNIEQSCKLMFGELYND